MTTIQLREHLIKLIQREKDGRLLAFLSRILERDSEENAYREMLLEGVKRSEEDIAAGRVYSLDEARLKAKDKLRDI